MSTFDEYVATFDGDPGYLNWASFGPLSSSVRAEVFADADLLGSGRPSSLALVAERVVQARELVAELLGGAPDDVTMQASATQGLQHALYGLPGEVIAATTEFPSITVTLERAAQASQGALVPRWISPADSFVTPDVVADALDDSVTALAVSHVDFRSGYRADLAGLRDVIGPDRLLIVDAVQSFGVIDEDYSAADVIVGHGYKWLRAGRGTGFAWFSSRARERIAPVLSSFAGIGQDIVVDEIPPAAASAQAYVASHPDQLAVARLAIGVRDVRDAGVAEIESAISERVGRIMEIADRHGIPVRTPRDPERRAGIVSLAPEAPGQLAAALTNVGVTATTRGDAVRVSAHAGTGDDGLRLLEEAVAASGSEMFTGL